MSYILDALRRLEQDKERTRKGRNPMEAVLVPDLEPANKPRRKLFWWAGAAVVLLAAALAAAHWITRSAIVFSTAQIREGTSSLPTPAHPIAQPSKPASLPEAQSPLAGRPPPDREPSALPEDRPPVSGPAVSPDSPAQVARQEVPAPPVSQTVSESAGAAEEGQAPAHESPDRVTRIADTPRESMESEVIRDWQGEDIKVNAIAYTQNADDRFAVVNLKTVRAGDEVGGLSVVEIEEEGVVFEQGGVKYRVSLGRR